MRWSNSALPVVLLDGALVLTVRQGYRRLSVSACVCVCVAGSECIVSDPVYVIFCASRALTRFSPPRRQNPAPAPRMIAFASRCRRRSHSGWIASDCRENFSVLGGFLFGPALRELSSLADPLLLLRRARALGVGMAARADSA